ncbi:patatin-like phospholipase family protein [bacterium]|nr:patatin-like phospholipase family protein [bacterium]
MKRIGLALGGGGARGLCHIEFIKVLDELHLKPSIISGTSIGSIIGAFYAAGFSGDEMTALIDTISLRELTRLLDFSILSPSGLVKGDRVIEFLEENLPAKRFEDLEIPLKIVATDFWNREEVVFESGELIPAIRASISIPGIFEPVNQNGVVMVDGGAVNPVPMSVIHDLCDFLIAVDVSGTNAPPKRNKIPSMFTAVMTFFQIMETSINREQRAIFNPDIYLRPRLENVQVLDFHRDDEILASVSDDVVHFRKELTAKLEMTSRPRVRNFLDWFRRSLA